MSRSRTSGWIWEALETNENLKHVILVGPPETAMEETKRELLEDGEELIRKVTWISEEEFLQNVEKPDGIKKLCGQCKENDLGADEKDPLPLYISIDKDILSESEGKTNWDQGNVRVDELLSLAKDCLAGRKVLAVDLCGEPSANAPEAECSAASLVNQKLYGALAAKIED